MADHQSDQVHPDGRKERPPDLHTQLEDLFNTVWSLEAWEAHSQPNVDKA